MQARPPSIAVGHSTTAHKSKYNVSSYHSGYRSVVTQNYCGTYQRHLNLDSNYDDKVENDNKGWLGPNEKMPAASICHEQLSQSITTGTNDYKTSTSM